MAAEKTLFVIGDSISIQYGPFMRAALPPHIAYDRKRGEKEALKDLDMPIGANGGDSSRVLAFVQELEEEPGFHKDLLVINCGLHDIKRDRETGDCQVVLEDYRENLKAIVTIGKRLSERMVWVRTTQVDDEACAARKTNFTRTQADIDAYADIASEVMSAEDIQEIPLDAFTRSLATQGPLFRDGVHFTESVQEAQGRFMAQACADCLGEEDLKPKL